MKKIIMLLAISLSVYGIAMAAPMKSKHPNKKNTIIGYAGADIRSIIQQPIIQV